MGYISDLFSGRTVGRPMVAGVVIGGCLSIPKGLPGIIGGSIGGALLFGAIWGICRFFHSSYAPKLQNFPFNQDITPQVENFPAKDPHRLDLDQAKQMLYKIVSEMNQNLFNYLYLFAFDADDRLIWGNVVLPDGAPNKLELIISWAELETELNAPDNIYFMPKLKTFPDYINGFIDMKGTMERVKGFIQAWKDFDKKKGGDNPALKRYTVEFVNDKLGLPFRYSETQRLKDMEELLK